MIDKALDAMRTQPDQIFCCHTQRQMRSPLYGIQVLRHRLEGPAESLQLIAGIDQNTRHTQNLIKVAFFQNTIDLIHVNI
jgi:hypothetical protein